MYMGVSMHRRDLVREYCGKYLQNISIAIGDVSHSQKSSSKELLS